MASPKLDTLWRLSKAAQSRDARARGLPPLWFMTDRARVADPGAVALTLPRGAGIILRDYDAPGRAELAHALAGIARRRGLLFLVAGDEALAAASGADGIHLPEWLAGRIRAIRRRHPSWLVTAAAHGRTALRRAALAGADAVFVSPVFPTRSHPDAPCLGVLRFAALVRSADVPVYALGGVNAQSIARLRATGAAGAAAIGGIAA
ncbi:thiamine phosphate synthase [Emcibacter sp. SYSU 3D8]|uniref:thiamine phosphate synthase n=1 Tax=Emcibacter sp. SYSU 3D8 TaxID=3133969 RepID=UPI0031FE8D0D